ncbi:hypothetical protein [Serinicoccus hydrothermalis]|nr:hypothetical protein [Serinicoccus hydrothermalis]
MSRSEGSVEGFTAMPFTYRRAREAGMTRAQLRRDHVCLLRSVYVDRRVRVDGYVRARAVLLVAPADAFVSHHTAAELWGAVVPHAVRPHVSVPTGRPRSAREDLVVHASSREPVMFRGQRVTTPMDTFLDCARVLDLVDLVVLGDSLVARRRISPEQLRQGAQESTGRGSRLARRAAGLVRAGVDSPMETRSRMLRVLAGLPELETDIRFHDERGDLVRRLDAGDRATRTAVEYDGRHHIERERSWEADLGRREDFEDAQWRIVVLVAADIYRTPGQTVERLRRIFAQRGIRLGPPSDEWRRYFPGQG